MPIFHDPRDSPPRRSPCSQVASSGQHQRVVSPDLPFERPLLQTVHARTTIDAQNHLDMDSGSPNHSRKPFTMDRMELIERLKRVNSPSQQLQQDQSSERALSREDPKSPLKATADLKPPRTSTPDPLRDIAAAGLAIERPRSALHSGDFREEKEAGPSVSGSTSSGFLATSPVAPWNRSFPTAALPTNRNEGLYSFNGDLGNDSRAVSRARAISQSSTTSFAFLPPTSPLVYQANNNDLDFPSMSSSRQGSKSPERTNRRHTFSPTSFQTYQSTPMTRSASGTPAARHLRYGSSIPYQAHQPRRSMTTNLSQSHSSPQSPFLGSRRPSISSEASPLQHAPMVGSYEESILRGRMSTTPSRPLNFVAKIGVLGKGQCKSSLKCPPHVTVPFPAVFYSYNTGNGRIADNEPSPYVGLIDLENSLRPSEENSDSGKRRRHTVGLPDKDNFDFQMSNENGVTGQRSTDSIRKKEKRKRRSTSPKAPPGGSYRIPPQGQLQVVLKNPNKTAVKLFLVPYDISDMEPGQKTFIRQRSYSAGPIIDMPSASRKNFGTDRPEASLSNSDDPNDRPILRYLIHLHICCPSKGRFYLYKSIRVVFANRVPDGKEKLRNEIQYPEPRYSAYKPTRDAAMSHFSSTGAQLTAEKAFRRRSAGWPLSQSQQSYDQIDGLGQRPPLPPPAMQFTGGPLSYSASSGFNSPIPNMQPIPFSLTRLTAIESRPVSRDQMEVDSVDPFRTPLTSPKPAAGSPMNICEGTFEKLNKGDVGYGGNAFSPVSSPTSPPSAGLLSQRLRELEVQRDDDQEVD